MSGRNVKLSVERAGWALALFGRRKSEYVPSKIDRGYSEDLEGENCRSGEPFFHVMPTGEDNFYLHMV